MSDRSARLPASLQPFRHRDFTLLMIATVMQNLVMPAQFMGLTFWAIDHYPDEKVLYSGLLMAMRGVGMLSFSLIGGAIADRFERRRVLLATEFGSFAVTALLALMLITNPLGGATILVVLVLVFLSAANMALDGPSRSASIPVIVGPAEMGRAIALSNVAQQLTFPIVLPIVGYLSATAGPGQVVAISLGAWVLSIPMIAFLRFTSRSAAHRRVSNGFVRDVRDGLGYARRNATIFAVMGMMVTMQVVGMPGVGPLGPIWMTEVLGLSRSQFGLIAMLWGVGAVLSSFIFAALPQVTRRGMTLVAMVVLFGICAVVFAHSRSVPLTTAANFGLGFAMTGTMVTSMTLVQYTATDDMRGRVMGLFPLVMGLSMLNIAPVSALGQAVGLEVVVPAFAWAALGLAFIIGFGAPGLRHTRPAPPKEIPRPDPAPASTA